MNRLLFGAIAAAVVSAMPARAETVNCTNITSLPTVITVQGIYCLKQDLATSIKTGAAITINTNNVTIDFNGFKLGGLAGGPTTAAVGVTATDRQNITLRNGNIRGFNSGISIPETTVGRSSGHLIEGNLLDGNTGTGIDIGGSGVIVRRNRVVNIDATPPPAPGMQPVPATYGAAASLPVGSSRMGSGLSNGVGPQAGTGGTVNGILGRNLRDSQIVDNFVSTMITTGSEAYGINLLNSDNVVIARNNVFNTRAGSFATGIENQSAAGKVSIVMDNIVIGGTAPTAVGIEAFTGIFWCLNNRVSGYAIQTSNCTPNQGTFPVEP